ncbi:hypothetical protein WA538_001467 [Blastocystis sp. DL]
MKTAYQTNEADGLRVLRMKCQSIYYACIEYGANGSAVIPMEYAYYYSLVVTYLQAIEKVGSLTADEKNLLVYCMYMVTTLMNKSVQSNNQTLTQRLGLQEKSQDADAAQVTELQQVTPQPAVLPAVGSIPVESTETDIVMESPSPTPVASPSSSVDATVANDQPAVTVSVGQPALTVSTDHPALAVSADHPALTMSTDHPTLTMSTDHPALTMSTDHPALTMSTDHPALTTSFSATCPTMPMDHPASPPHPDPTAAMLDASTQMLNQSQALLNMMSMDLPADATPLTSSDSVHSLQPTLSPSTSIPAQPSEPASSSKSAMALYPPSVPNSSASTAPVYPPPVDSPTLHSSTVPSAPIYPPTVSVPSASIYPPSLPKPLPMPSIYPPSNDVSQSPETVSQPSLPNSVNPPSMNQPPLPNSTNQPSLPISTSFHDSTENSSTVESDLPIPTESSPDYRHMSKTEQAFHLGKLLSEAKELASRLPDDTLKMELQKRLSYCYYLSSALYR